LEKGLYGRIRSTHRARPGWAGFFCIERGQKGLFPCPIQCPQFIGIKKEEEKRRIPYIETIHV
jgi:hypothetical protein